MEVAGVEKAESSGDGWPGSAVPACSVVCSAGCAQRVPRALSGRCAKASAGPGAT